MAYDTQDIKVMLRDFYNREAAHRNENDVQEWKIGPKALFLSHLKAENKSELLEIGAGTGKDSKYFADNGLNVTAVDLSPEMVKYCRDRGIDAFELDYYNLSELGGTFDAVWSMNSLLHVKRGDLPQVLSEIDGVLNASGLFHMGVYGGEDWEGLLESENFGMPRYFSIYTDESLREILEKQFNIVSFETIETGNTWHSQSVILRKR